MKLEAVMNGNGKDELVRMAKMNGVKANYTKEQLSRKAMPSPSFDLHEHYVRKYD